MARGWESKGVESQIEDAKRDDPRRRLSHDEIETTRKREGLELSRQRVARELEQAKAPVRKTALQHALKHLDDELRKF
jgi:hypothetical protein